MTGADEEVAGLRGALEAAMAVAADAVEAAESAQRDATRMSALCRELKGTTRWCRKEIWRLRDIVSKERGEKAATATTKRVRTSEAY